MKLQQFRTDVNISSLSFMLPCWLLIASDDGRICPFRHPNWGFFTYLTTKLGSIDTGKRHFAQLIHNILAVYWLPDLEIMWKNYDEQSYWTVRSETCLFAFWTYDISSSAMRYGSAFQSWITQYVQIVSFFCWLIIICCSFISDHKARHSLYIFSIIFTNVMDFYHFFLQVEAT